MLVDSRLTLIVRRYPVTTRIEVLAHSLVKILIANKIDFSSVWSGDVPLDHVIKIVLTKNVAKKRLPVPNQVLNYRVSLFRKVKLVNDRSEVFQI